MKFTQRLSWVLLFSLFIPLMAEAATLTYGSTTTINDVSTTSNGGAKIDSTHVILVYKDAGAGKAVIGTVDGMTLTVGSEYQFCAATCNNLSVTVLDSTHAFISYERSNTGYGVIATISGSTISYGTAANFSSSVKAGTQVIAVAALDSTHVAINYLDQTGSSPFFTYVSKAVVAAISGTTVTYGSPTTLSSNSQQYAAITAMDSTHFMAFYGDAGPTPHLIAASVSGTSMTFGSAITFSGYSSDPSISALDATHALAVYRSTSSDNTYAFVATLSDTTVTAGSSQAVMSVSGYYPYAVALDDAHAVVIYRNNADSGARIYATHLTVASGVVTGDTASLALDVNIGNLNRFVVPLDSSSALLVSMDKAVVATTDTTAPGAPSSFAATPSANSVSLSWTNPVDSDFLSNSIRSGTGSYPTSISDGRSVASGVTGTSTTDTGLSDGTYYYSIFARDLRGNYSTVAHATATVDGTAPASPGSFTATTSNTTISLSWTNPVDSDFSSVSIRKASGDYPSSITAGTALVSNSTATSASDSGLSEGAYFYSIFAIDTAGNVSTAAHATTAVITGNKSSGGSAQSGGGGGGAHRAAAASTRTSPSPSPSVAHPAATTSSPSSTTHSTPSHSPAAQTAVTQVLTTVRARLEERVNQQIAVKPGVAPMLKKMLARMEARIAKSGARVSRK